MIAVVSAHDKGGASVVLAAKDSCLALLAAVHGTLYVDDYRALYGQVLDAEDTGTLRGVYKEIRSHVPAHP